MPKPQIRDPQSEAVKNALTMLEFDPTLSISMGKNFYIEVESTSYEHAQKSIKDMCEKLLANPVSEMFEFERINSH